MHENDVSRALRYIRALIDMYADGGLRKSHCVVGAVTAEQNRAAAILHGFFDVLLLVGGRAAGSCVDPWNAKLAGDFVYGALVVAAYDGNGDAASA